MAAAHTTKLAVFQAKRIIKTSGNSIPKGVARTTLFRRERTRDGEPPPLPKRPLSTSLTDSQAAYGQNRQEQNFITHACLRTDEVMIFSLCILGHILLIASVGNIPICIGINIEKVHSYK